MATISLLETSMSVNHSSPGISRVTPGGGGHVYSDGVARYRSENYTYFRAEGCWINGTRNCTTMCMDPDLIWASGILKPTFVNVTANLANCISYLLVSEMLLQDNVSTYSLAKESQNIATLYGILPATPANVQAINDSTSKCLQEFCRVPGRCAGDWVAHKDDGPFDISLPYYPSLCKNSVLRMNNDIIGIGTMVAYLIAAGILFVAYVSVRLSSSFVKYISLPYHITTKRDYATAMTASKRLQAAVSSSHHTAILISTMADFQKSQCIFWLSINLAGLLIILGSASTLGAPNFESLIVNLTGMYVIAYSALLFVTLGFYCLHVAGKRSWYISCASVLSSSLSAVIFTNIRSDWENLDPSTDTSAGCGRFSPTTYCDGFEDYLGSDPYTSKTNIYRFQTAGLLSDQGLSFCFIVQFFLIVDFVSHNTGPGKRLISRIESSYLPVARAWRILLMIMRIPVEVIFLFLLGWMCVYFRSLNRAGIEGGSTTWGFGQIISLTIWLPIFLEWLYATIRGLDHASEHRIAQPYQLVRTVSQVQKYDHYDNSATAVSSGRPDADSEVQLKNLPRRRTDLEHRLSYTGPRPSSPNDTAASTEALLPALSEDADQREDLKTSSIGSADSISDHGETQASGVAELLPPRRRTTTRA